MPTFLQTNLSFFVVLSAGVIAALISWYMYRRTVPPINRRMAIFLGVLRGLYISAIIVFLFKPEMTLVWRLTDRMNITILVDRSASMGISDGNIKRIDQANMISSRIRELAGEKADIHNIAFDTDTFSIVHAGLDSLNSGTDISRALQLIERSKPTPDAVILVTDGNYSVGKNPLHRGTNSRIPIYAIGVGDTTEPVDVLVTDIQTPKIAYQNKEMAIQVNLMTTGIDSVQVELELRHDGKTIGKRDLMISRSNQEYATSFAIIPRNPGRKIYELYVTPLSGERNLQNNRALVQVRILKERLGVALLTARADNDYKFLKLLLQENKYLKVFPVIDIGRRIGPRLVADSIDVVIWNQIPSVSEISALSSGLDLTGYPTLLLISERLDGQKMTFLQKYISVTAVNYLGRNFRTQVSPTEAGSKFAVINVLENREANQRFWQAAPPVDYMFGEISAPGGMNVLLETVSPLDRGERGLPVLLTGRSGGRRNALLLGAGFWRWHFMLAENSQFNNTWKRILHNLTRWMASSREAKNVQLTIQGEESKTGEKVHLMTDVYDGAFEPVDSAIVRFQVSGPDGSFEIPASNISDGKYQGEFVPASEGKYILKSVAWLSDQFLGSDSLNLQVLPVSQEFIYTRQNADLLTRLSTESGGEYFSAERADSILAKLDLTPGITKKTTTYKLWDRLSVLLLIFIMLSVEWFIRRRRGLA